MSKLTLSVDPKVAARAKKYAREHGTSVSQLVETYLAAVSKPAAAEAEDPPILRSLRGSLKGADVEDYYRYLESKYK